MTPHDKHSTSIHEAAHVLACHLGGIPVDFVSVEREGDSLGRCMITEEATNQLLMICDPGYNKTEEDLRYMDVANSGQLEEAAELWTALEERSNRNSDEDSHIVDAYCIEWYAGPAATARHTGRPFHECLKDQPDDESSLKCIMHWLQDDERIPLYQAEMQREAQEMIADPAQWYAIEVLAKLLDTRSKIKGPEATSIIANALAEYRDIDRSIVDHSDRDVF